MCAQGRGLGLGLRALESDKHSPLADRLAALEVRGQVAHAVHGLHQLPQVRLDLREQRPLGPAPLSPAPQNLPFPLPPAQGRTSSMARISRRSLSITVIKSWERVCVRVTSRTPAQTPDTLVPLQRGAWGRPTPPLARLSWRITWAYPPPLATPTHSYSQGATG